MDEKLRVFYDGACHLCYREMMSYKKKDRDGLLLLEDISAAHFKAQDFGLDEQEVNLHMHAMNEDGRIFRGVESFVEIWKRLPYFKYLVPLVESRALRPSIDKGYNIFAKYVRPNLPKRKCQDHCNVA